MAGENQIAPKGMIDSVPPQDQLLVKLGASDLGNPAARILYAWIDRMSDATGLCKDYPGTTVMATLCGLSKMTVHRAEQELVERRKVEFSADGQGRARLRQAKILSPELSEGLVLAYHTHVGAGGGHKPTREVQASAVSVQPAPPPGEPSPVQIAPVKSPRRMTRKAAAAAGVEGDQMEKKKTQMTDEDLNKINGSIEGMTKWLCWGKQGLYAEDPKVLPPTNTNWKQFGTYSPEGRPLDPGVEKWEHNTFVGYYWFNVSLYNHNNGIPLRIPNFGRLCRAIADERQRLTKQQLYGKIVNIAYYWDVIRMILRDIGKELNFDESSLQNQLVGSKLEAICQMPHQEKEALIQKAKDMKGR